MNIMPRSSSQIIQARFQYAPVGFIEKLRSFLAGMVRFDAAASSIYAENEQIRASGRNWLM
jgi:hypothetical protein